MIGREELGRLRGRIGKAVRERDRLVERERNRGRL